MIYIPLSRQNWPHNGDDGHTGESTVCPTTEGDLSRPPVV